MNLTLKSVTLLLSLSLVGIAVSAQQTVHGTLTDEAGRPVIGGSVVVKGTTGGAVADLDGRFTLKDVPTGAVLVFSSIGYETVEAVYDGSPLRIVLKEDTRILDEVVVVGYATMKKRDLVGAVDQVGDEVIGNRANSNLARSLQGEVAGLNITINDSKPSHAGSYNVRGTGSIGAGGSSLVLIDGVEGDLSMVNPQDVASVSVLKDASSTAVYGARGAFGVILVTTKAARKGTPVVNYNGSVSVNRRTVIPDGITDSNEWLDWWIAAYNGYYQGSRAILNHIDSKVPYSQAIYDEILRRKNDPTLSKVAESHDISGFGYAYYDNHDWFDEFYRDYHWSTEHNVSVSGGGEYADYFVSGRLYDSQGVYKVGDERYKKYNLRGKGTLRIRPWMKLTNNMSVSIDRNYIPTTYNNNSVSRYMQHCLSPMAPLRNLDGTWTPAAGVSGYASLYEKSSYLTDDYIYLRDKLDLDVDLIKDVLKFQADYSYNYTGRTRGSVFRPVSYSKEPGVILVTSTQKVDSYMEQQDYDTRYQAVNAYLTFSPKVGKDNTLSFLAGYNAEWSRYKTVTMTRTGFTSEKPSFKLMDGEASITQGGNEWAYVGAFYRVNYAWKSRYLAEVSGRYDGSSKFPMGSRWGFFPSASVGWRVSEEPWMQWSHRALDNLKVRLSAGSMGNGNVAPYLYTSEMTVAKASDIVLAGSLPSYTSVASVVPWSLTWETATTYDAGLDIDLLQNRISASFDYYVRLTSDMYTAGATLPGVFGGTVPKGNNAELRTDGWELSIQWRDQFNLAGKPFHYSIKGTLWDATSVVTKFAGNDEKTFGTIANLIGNMGQPDYYEGMKLGEMWGYTVAGLFKDQADIDASPTQNYKQSSDLVTHPGQVKFTDLDGDGIIDYKGLTLTDHGDLSIIGNSTPRYRFGLNLSGQWNGFGLSVFLQGVGKRDWYPGKDAGYFWGKYSRPFFYFIPSIHAQDNPDVAQMNEDGTECLNWDTAYWPRLTTYVTNDNANKNTILNMPNTRYMQNAAYLRVKNVQLDYTLPAKASAALGLSAVKVYVNAENLLTFTPLHKWGPNLDPEGIDGGDTDFYMSDLNGNSYPIFKTVTCGVSITF
ncbi:MAG: TonB-dependent receptor [Bacteroidales bacterium]|nr:TonB-dependent receptor [Bacteroidales bacterium]